MDSFQITDETIVELRKKNVPDDVLAKLASMKDKDFDSRTGFLNALSRDRFKITDAVMDELRDRGVPHAVLNKLANLKDQEFESRDSSATPSTRS